MGDSYFEALWRRTTPRTSAPQPVFDRTYCGLSLRAENPPLDYTNNAQFDAYWSHVK